jgi:serine/threonine protein kinase
MHRDLKPENVMKHDGVYKITDFGFAKPNPGSNMQQTILGT